MFIVSGNAYNHSHQKSLTCEQVKLRQILENENIIRFHKVNGPFIIVLLSDEYAEWSSICYT